LLPYGRSLSNWAVTLCISQCRRSWSNWGRYTVCVHLYMAEQCRYTVQCPSLHAEGHGQAGLFHCPSLNVEGYGKSGLLHCPSLNAESHGKAGLLHCPSLHSEGHGQAGLLHCTSLYAEGHDQTWLLNFSIPPSGNITKNSKFPFRTPERPMSVYKHRIYVLKRDNSCKQDTLRDILVYIYRFMYIFTVHIGEISSDLYRDQNQTFYPNFKHILF
jgi:hypothetical protein